MDSSYRPLSRAAQLAIGGVMIAFAWLLLSVVFGLGAGHAHAEDADQDGGVLSSLTGAVGGTVGTVVDVAGDTATTVVPVVQPVVETVTTVVPPAAPVLEAVADTTAAVIEPVQEVASSGVVTEVVTPVVDLVSSVPVVGGVVTALGVDDAATSVAGTVDDAASGLTGTVGSTVPAVIVPASSNPGGGGGHAPGTVDGDAAPAVGGSASADAPVAGGLVTAPTTTHAPRAAFDATAGLRALLLTGAAAAASADAAVADALLTADSGAGGLLQLLRSVLPADSVFAGSGGAGPGAWVLVALVLVVAHRAWVRRNGLENDAPPAAPTFATDVSPD
ncbi:hypothetical protein [Microbacterium pygmaeum]|uniref:Uncharacterized protein n=1 Tax=Microbacterium pygmaeum TaxID=370764 RepID=A0A1G7UVV3_9MICO|nr:hypothetical protein [Microbacterium pygmaeum]SDG51636.1 hypothetical protein SAMN04489810_0509 [Microbacterium pygmaeum]